jgi:hypothetical protein
MPPILWAIRRPPTTSPAYRETVKQANILSYADDFWLPLTVYCLVFLLIPFMHRVRSRQSARARRSGEGSDEGARDPRLPARAD